MLKKKLSFLEKTKGMNYKITFKGNIPAKKNSKQIGVNKWTRRPFITTSKTFKKWYKQVSDDLKNNLPNLITEPIKQVSFTYFPKNSRLADLSNSFESVMDFLVDKNVISDDNYFVISKCILEFGGVDKFDPRGEVVINC